MPFTYEQARFYLAAMIDGEGTVAKLTGKTPKVTRVTNTDRELITACEECCGVLGLRYKVFPRKSHKAHWAPGWDLVISGKESIRILTTLPLRSAKKRERLEAILKSYRTPRPDPSCSANFTKTGRCPSRRSAPTSGDRGHRSGTGSSRTVWRSAPSRRRV